MQIALQLDQYALHLAPLLTTSYSSYANKLAANKLLGTELYMGSL
jgi:hypothetical protein